MTRAAVVEWLALETKTGRGAHASHELLPSESLGSAFYDALSQVMAAFYQ